MLYQFICDAANLLRLKLLSADGYRYPPSVFIGILLLLGLTNAAGISPLFGNSPAVIALAVAFTFARWAILSAVMQSRLQLPARGFILATEALSIPVLAVFYLPQLAFAASLWQGWALAVQIIGLMRLSGKSAGRVIISYVIALFLLLLVGMSLTVLFNLFGLIDAQAMHQTMMQMLESR